MDIRTKEIQQRAVRQDGKNDDNKVCAKGQRVQYDKILVFVGTKKI